MSSDQGYPEDFPDCDDLWSLHWCGRYNIQIDQLEIFYFFLKKNTSMTINYVSLCSELEDALGHMHLPVLQGKR